MAIGKLGLSLVIICWLAIACATAWSDTRADRRRTTSADRRLLLTRDDVDHAGNKNDDERTRRELTSRDSEVRRIASDTGHHRIRREDRVDRNRHDVVRDTRIEGSRTERAAVEDERRRELARPADAQRRQDEASTREARRISSSDSAQRESRGRQHDAAEGNGRNAARRSGTTDDRRRAASHGHREDDRRTGDRVIRRGRSEERANTIERNAEMMRRRQSRIDGQKMTRHDLERRDDHNSQRSSKETATGVRSARQERNERNADATRTEQRRHREEGDRRREDTREDGRRQDEGREDRRQRVEQRAVRGRRGEEREARSQSDRSTDRNRHERRDVSEDNRRQQDRRSETRAERTESKQQERREDERNEMRRSERRERREEKRVRVQHRRVGRNTDNDDTNARVRIAASEPNNARRSTSIETVRLAKALANMESEDNYSPVNSFAEKQLMGYTDLPNDMLKDEQFTKLWNTLGKGVMTGIVGLALYAVKPAKTVY